MTSVIYDEKARRMAEEMVMVEGRHIAQRKAQECDCKNGMFPHLPASRRSFLFAAGSAVSLSGSTAALAQKAPPNAVANISYYQASMHDTPRWFFDIGFGHDVSYSKMWRGPGCP